MKRCSKCRQEKDNSEFFMKNSATGRLHAQCKSCYRAQRKKTHAAHYAKNRDAYLLRAKRRRDELRRTFRENMLALLKNRECALCGENDIRVLEFDHLSPKSKGFSISQAVKLGHSWDVVIKEINKCQILCANCHKKRTAEQIGWYKSFTKIHGGTERT